jgi:hypothetical protein
MFLIQQHLLKDTFLEILNLRKKKYGYPGELGISEEKQSIIKIYFIQSFTIIKAYGVMNLKA